MKKIILLTGLFCFSSALMGQITYGSDDFISVGDEIVYSRALSATLENDFAENGENVSWDFSELTTLGIDTVSYFDPDDSGYRFYFCLTNAYIFNCASKFEELTNIAEVGLDSFSLGDFQAQNVTRHYKLTDEKFAETMLGVTAQLEGLDVPVAIDFEEEDVILHFPLQYGNIDSSRSVFEIDLAAVGFNVGIKRERFRTTEVEGFGQLTTPAGTYDKVLKIKSTIFNTDTTYLDSITIPLSTVEVEYKWFAKGEKGPVMQASGIVIADNEVISNVQYQGTEQTSAIEVVDQIKEKILIFPNPFSTTINIQKENDSPLQIVVYDLLGREVYSKNTDQTLSRINLDFLSAGNYFMQVFEGNRAIETVKIAKIED